MESITELKANGAHENGIASVHQVHSAVCELSIETKEDCSVKQEYCVIKQEDCVVKKEDGLLNDNVSPEVVEEDPANGYACVLKKEVSTSTIQPGQAIFLVKSWRTHLCRCLTCLRMYEERGLVFLLDSDDTLQVQPLTFLGWLYIYLSLNPSSLGMNY